MEKVPARELTIEIAKGKRRSLGLHCISGKRI